MLSFGPGELLVEARRAGPGPEREVPAEVDETVLDTSPPRPSRWGQLLRTGERQSPGWSEIRGQSSDI